MIKHRGSGSGDRVARGFPQTPFPTYIFNIFCDFSYFLCYGNIFIIFLILDVFPCVWYFSCFSMIFLFLIFFWSFSYFCVKVIFFIIFTFENFFILSIISCFIDNLLEVLSKLTASCSNPSLIVEDQSPPGPVFHIFCVVVIFSLLISYLKIACNFTSDSTLLQRWRKGMSRFM